MDFVFEFLSQEAGSTLVWLRRAVEATLGWLGAKRSGREYYSWCNTHEACGATAKLIEGRAVRFVMFYCTDKEPAMLRSDSIIPFDKMTSMNDDV